MADSIFQKIPPSSMITAIDPLPTNPNIRRVKVNGKLAARLNAADVEALGLTEGKAWTARLAKRVQQAVEAAKARRDAMNILGRRALSRGELIERLQRKGHVNTVALNVVEHLAADGWLDDLQYARSIVHALCSRKPAGTELILKTLRARQISDELAHRIAEEVTNEAHAIERAVTLIESQASRIKKLTPSQAVRRLASMLLRRGFEEDVAFDALRQCGYSIQDSE